MESKLGKPLCLKTATTEEIAMLNDLQGNILKSHGRSQSAHVFLHFGNQPEARAFIRAIGSWVKSARQQLDEAQAFRELRRSAGRFVAFFLSAAGYRALGVEPEHTPAEAAFRAGMRERSTLLDDPPIDDWEKHLRQEIHAMVLLADDTDRQVAQHVWELRQTTRRYRGVSVVGIEIGKALKKKITTMSGQEKLFNIEHFGYVDGLSVPVMLSEDVPEPREHWSSEAPLAQALVADPGGQDGLSFGSYFVFRKLEQNVRAFKQAEERLAHALELDGDDAERAGAMMIGRFENGSPLVLSPTNDRPGFNDFTFAEDLAGQRCPFQAHTRKVDPRGESAVPPRTFSSNAEEERSRLLVRRGITYGDRTDDPADEELLPEQRPAGGVGLLFMAYQRSIEEQFEFIQQQWVNAPNYVEQGTGPDPLIARQNAGSQCAEVDYQWLVGWGENEKPRGAPLTLGSFVTLKGGEYFFAPSISFLRSL